MNAPHQCSQCQCHLPADAPEGLCPACLMRGGLDTDATIKMTPSQMRTPSHATVSPSPEELAPLFPQLEILELLGRGGMGTVYKARQTKLNRFVALKIISAEAGADPHFAERFQREAQALAKLNHPHIVSVFDFGETGGLFYFLMEYVDGANLRTLIRSGEMKPEAALALIPAFCDALQYAHDEGVVHRDIKPENVLVDKKGRVKIADFGLAKLLGHDAHDHTLTRTGMYLGTPRYMAPEQVEKPETVDHRADIYSLGVVFYEMLTGEIPMGRFAPPSQKVQVDVRFDEIVLHALERDVALRYQHASEIKTDVQNVTGTPAPAAGTPATPPATGASAVDWEEHDARQLAKAVWVGLSAMSYLGICIALQGIIMTLRSGLTAGSAPFPWVQALVFGVMLANVVIALVVFIKARNRASDSFVRTGAINLVCAGSLLTIACGNWFDVPSWLGSIYLGAAFIGWMIFCRPNIKTAFTNLPLPGGAVTNSNEAEPRLSRMALIGAIWALFGVIAVIPSLFLSRTVTTAVEQAGGVSSAQPPLAFTIFMAVLLCIGASAPIGTTILGAISMNNIKRSSGKLCGLPLAFADMVFFPMLLLHGAMAVLLGLLILTIMKLAGVNAGLGALEMGLLAMLPLIADFFIVRALWRKVAGTAGASAKGDPASKLNLAGVGLLLAGIADAFAGLFWAGQNVVRVVEAIQHEWPAGWLVAETLLSLCILSVVYYVIGAALFLMRREHAGDITFPLIIAALVLPGCFVGLPAAIYAFVLLSRPEVKALFPQAKPEPESEGTAADTARGKRLVLAAVGIVAVLLGLFVMFSNREAMPGGLGLFASSTPLIVGEGPGMKEPNHYLCRYKISAPPDHRVVMWMEVTREGKPVVLPGLANRIEIAEQLVIGESFEGGAEFSLMDGSRISPDSKGRWRWDFKFNSRTMRTAPGGWIDNPFEGKGMTNTDLGPKRWQPKPGETVSIMVIRAGREFSGSDFTQQPPAGEIELRLKARIDLVPLFHRRVSGISSTSSEPYPAFEKPLARIAAGFEIDTKLPDDKIRRALIEKLKTNPSKRADAEAILKSVGEPVTKETKPEDVLKALEAAATTMK